jgi:hypothetical protein
MKINALVLAIIVSLVSFSQADAQTARPDSVKHRNDCRLAGQVLDSGHPANRLEWAAYYVRRCGPGMWAHHSVAAVKRYRNSRNSDALALVWENLGWLHDQDVFDAAGEIARDRTSSREARLWAILTLAKYVDPRSTYTLATLTAPPSAPGDRPTCVEGTTLTDHEVYERGRPFVSDYRQRVRDLADALAQESDPLLRVAGVCLGSAPQPLEIFDRSFMDQQKRTKQ